MKYQPRRLDKENLDWINMIYASDLSSKAKLVASVLSSYMHSKPEANPGLGRLTAETSLSKRSVQNGIDELHAEGWISKKRGGVTDRGLLLPNIYQLTWPDGIGREKSPEKTAEHDAQTIAPDAIVEGQTIAPVAMGYSTSCHTPIAPVATKQDIKQEKNKRERRAPTTIDPMTIPLPTAVSPEAWQDWVEYKRERKQPLKAKSVITKTLNCLARFSFEAQQVMVDYSIRGNYPGLYENQAKEPSNATHQQGSQHKNAGTTRHTATDTSWADGLRVESG